MSKAIGRDISVVIPVYNEEKNIPLLLPRLVKTMDETGRAYEILFVNDGSRDNSSALLHAASEENPLIRLIEMPRNIGQHAALLAGFAQTHGRYVITLDADLQNPPEEIPKILKELEAGHDVVGGVRMNRQDTIFRKTASWFVNRVTSLITKIELRDCGCMLRGYTREIAGKVAACDRESTFIPARALLFAKNPTDIPVRHAARAQGESKYSLSKLVRLNFEVMTGFAAFNRRGK